MDLAYVACVHCHARDPCTVGSACWQFLGVCLCFCLDDIWLSYHKWTRLFARSRDKTDRQTDKQIKTMRTNHTKHKKIMSNYITGTSGRSCHVQKVMSRSYIETTTRSAVTVRTRTKFGSRAFSVSGPTVWNSLPSQLRLRPIDCRSTFHRRLKSDYFQLAFY